jgi:hypothetical protein
MRRSYNCGNKARDLDILHALLWDWPLSVADGCHVDDGAYRRLVILLQLALR